MSELIPFSNGTQFLDWQECNCCRCKKYKDWFVEELTCDLQKAIEDASCGDGTVSEEIYKRLGAGTGKYCWMCPDVEWTEAWKQECGYPVSKAVIQPDEIKIFTQRAMNGCESDDWDER